MEGCSEECEGYGGKLYSVGAGGGGDGFGVFWLNRNDCVFNNKIVSSPHAILFHLISFLQHWMVVSLGCDRGVLELMVEDFKAQVPEEMVAAGVG
jgi:hypothetical protein